MSDDASMWPTTVDDLVTEQHRLADAAPEPWRPSQPPLAIGGCWVSFPRGLTGRGAAGDPAWTAAVLMLGHRVRCRAVRQGVAGAAYSPGLLALRLGPLLESVVRSLPERPGVLLLDATGRDHPRRAGLAVQLGAVLDLPTVGVTHRPLLAEGEWPSGAADTSPLLLGHDVVGHWLRARPGVRPLAVHAGWRTDPDTAVAVVRAALAGRRTPEPMRESRRLARRARNRGLP
jgi:deoxyribonuclease V